MLLASLRFLGTMVAFRRSSAVQSRRLRDSECDVGSTSAIPIIRLVFLARYPIFGHKNSTILRRFQTEPIEAAYVT